MKKTLDDIRQEVEAELDLAEGLSEIMMIIYAGSKSFERNDITFEKISGSFGLIAQLLDEHVRKLDHIANGLIDFENDLTHGTR